MKIRLVSEHASPLALLGGVDAGGQNVHVAELARDLAKLGADVVVHTRRDDPSLPRTVPWCPGVVIDHVDAGPPVPIPKDELFPHMGELAAGLERHWRTDRPDVVHAHYWMSGLAATYAADRVGVPVALTYHALGIEKRQQQGEADTSPPHRIAVETWLATTVDRVLATTSAERLALTRIAADPDRVTVIPCGVDLDLFAPAAATSGGRNARWANGSRPRQRPRIVSVSRLVRRKGLAEIIEAVAGLPDAELVVAGGPPEAMLVDDPYACELAAFAAELGVRDRVHLIGAVDHHRVPELLRSATVVCCTPWYEPFGLVAIEAMACGVPVVATSVGGLAETVDDGRTGVLVPPRDPAAIRSALRSLLDDPGRRAAMGAAAVRRAASYGWQPVARRTLDVASQLARQGRRRDASALPPDAAATAGFAAGSPVGPTLGAWR